MFAIGTFAVITIMIGKVVSSYEHQYTPTEIATTLCLVVGMIQVNCVAVI